MTIVTLSERLARIASKVPSQSRVADIGSDHGLLPTYLVQQGIALFAVAGEVNAGPLEAATRQVAEAGLQQHIQTRLGNGLAVITPGEVDCISIAGMGGGLIVRILDEGKKKLQGVKRLLLQPNVGAELVRMWLIDNGWLLTEEDILEEDGKIYEILVAEPGGSDRYGEPPLYEPFALPCGLIVGKSTQLRMGPHLLKAPNAAFVQKWESEADKLRKILKQLAMSELEASRVKEEEVNADISEIEEVLACLQKARP